ncbi:MAG: sulfatase [Planctomycetota bacterium]
MNRLCSFFSKAFLILLVFVVSGILGCSKESPEKDRAENSLDPPFQPPVRISRQAEAERPRLVVLILIDTLRADYVGAYGSDRGLTPCIDALAEESYLFEQAIATSSWTRSSIASLFTSCYPSSIGVLERMDMLSEDLLTLAELLKVYGGFRCIGISTNHNAGKGFGYAQGFDQFFIPDVRAGYPEDKQKVPLAKGVTLDALRIIKRWKEQAKAPPLFLWLHYLDPHAPYLLHPELVTPPKTKGRFSGAVAHLMKMDKVPLDELTPEDRAHIEYLYSGEVFYCDHWIGRLLKGIKELGLNDATCLALTADHGEGLWDHGKRDHGCDLYEEQIHVPLLIRLPGMKKGDAKRISRWVSLVDVAPTLLSICRIPKPAQFQGFDLGAVMEGRQRTPALDYIYSEMNLDEINLESIRKDGYKLIRNRSQKANQAGAYELFDLSSDPSEKKDLAGLDDSGGRKKDLGEMMWKWREKLKVEKDAIRQFSYDELDQQTLDNLRALGYIGGDEGKTGKDP